MLIEACPAELPRSDPATNPIGPSRAAPAIIPIEAPPAPPNLSLFFDAYWPIALLEPAVRSPNAYWSSSRIFEPELDAALTDATMPLLKSP
jgi:hypothetical protein